MELHEKAWTPTGTAQTLISNSVEKPSGNVGSATATHAEAENGVHHKGIALGIVRCAARLCHVSVVTTSTPAVTPNDEERTLGGLQLYCQGPGRSDLSQPPVYVDFNARNVRRILGR